MAERMNDNDGVDSPECKKDNNKSKTDFRDYYSMIRNQQNMLEDFVRTGTYQAAIMENPTDFAGKVVLDVGAGSGILSMFAARAGAKKVYAVEASDIATFCERLVAGNGLSDIVKVIKGNLNEIELPEKVDVIISEPIGVLLVHERMLETYVRARQLALKPGGKMFPNASTIKLCPFSDAVLYLEQQRKSVFWDCPDFYGFNLTPLKDDAVVEHFSQPVVGMFDPQMLIAHETVNYHIDYLKITPEDLHNIEIPFSFKIARTDICHGIATWFDADFFGSDKQVVLVTAPHAPVTHWQQCRLLLRHPIAVNAGQTLSGVLSMTVNEYLSYNMTLTVKLDDTDVSTTMRYALQNQLYRYVPTTNTACPTYSTTPGVDQTNNLGACNNYTNNFACN